MASTISSIRPSRAPVAIDRAVRFHELAGFKREMTTVKTVPFGSVKIEEIRLKRALN